MQKGFSLIELITVVAIIGVLSAVGVIAYNGYISAAKKTSAQNIMQQIALAQTEEYSNTGGYYENTSCDSPSVNTSREIEDNLLGGANVLTKAKSADERMAIFDYYVCIKPTDSGYEIIAEEDKDDEACKITLDNNSVWTRENC